MELNKKGIVVPMNIPTAIQLPFRNEKAGYMMAYTYDKDVAKKMRQQLQFMCDTIKLPLDNKYNAGYAVRLKMDVVELTAVNDVACIDALVKVYREGRQ